MTLKPVDPNQPSTESPLNWTPRELLRHTSNMPVRGTLVIVKLNDGTWQCSANGLSPEETAYAVSMITVLQANSISLQLHNSKTNPPSSGGPSENPAS